MDVKGRIGDLRVKYRPFKTLDQLHVSLLSRKQRGEFQYHRSPPPSLQHTLFRGEDGGIVAYHVPAAALQNQDDLSAVFDNLQSVRRRKHKGVDRGVAIQRHYIVWCGRSASPMVSAEFKEDGEVAETFMNASAGMFEEASENPGL